MSHESERKGIQSELYTAEAGESRTRAVGDQTAPDPTPEEGEKAIAKFVIRDDDGEID